MLSEKDKLKLNSNLDFVDDEVNGGILTVINKKQFARVRRLAKYCVSAATEAITQYCQDIITVVVE